jgi:hypothetical protein
MLEVDLSSVLEVQWRRIHVLIESSDDESCMIPDMTEKKSPRKLGNIFLVVHNAFDY